MVSAEEFFLNTFCDWRPNRSFLQKIALKISGLDHALEDEEGVWGGGGDPPPRVVRHSNISLPTACHTWRPSCLETTAAPLSMNTISGLGASSPKLGDSCGSTEDVDEGVEALLALSGAVAAPEGGEGKRLPLEPRCP